jgi:hypothetical protein
MQPNIVHALSTYIAGFVIAAYWLIYVVVIAFDTAYPATYDVCERDQTHNIIVESCAATASDAPWWERNERQGAAT